MSLENDIARLKEHHAWMDEEVAMQLLAAGNFLSTQGGSDHDAFITYLCSIDTDQLKLSALKVNG